MSDTISCMQAAQKLLGLLSTLGLLLTQDRGKDPKRGSRTEKTDNIPDASSISWAFHESVDKTGFLHWLVENISARRNGLTDSELELIDYLQRTGYKPLQHFVPESIEHDHYVDRVNTSILPAFELQKQRRKTEKRVDQLESHLQVIGAQNELLNSRVDHLTKEIGELKAEEDFLVRVAAVSDLEVARAVATYTGQLDETALASKSLVDKLQIDKATTTKPHMHYYQCLGAIDKLQEAMQSQFKSTAEQICDLVKMNNSLPSPWKEFIPFAAQSIPELLHVAETEHTRIKDDALVLAKKKLQCEVESELLTALAAEADRLLLLDNYKELLERCRSISGIDSSSSSVDLAIDKAAFDIADPVIKQIRDTMVPSEYKQALDMLNCSHNELVCVQTQSIDKKIGSVLSLFDSQQNAVESILRVLVNENSMIDGWSRLWSRISTDLDSQNNELIKQKSDLESAAEFAVGSQQLIRPDDILALSLKRLLSMSVKASNAVLSLSENGRTGSAQKNLTVNFTELLQTLLDSQADFDNDMQVEGTADIHQQIRRDPWLSQDAAFTSWELLLADAKECHLLKSMADDAVDAESKACLDIEHKM
ncbi:hypothetical protein J3B02_003746 [Coemansia erecta]|nr:hypothetical protein J3B02_003746 [Coemansia erecta]